MNVLICGGRQFKGRYKFDEAMKLLPFTPSVIIHGGADGADLMGDQWAKSNGIFSIRIDALWQSHGNGAGPKRNQAMLDLVKIDYCIAFPGGNGTNDMIERCVANNIPVWQPYL
tara:strand:- start:303 stop:644 length:342 start_codon:yes stop_codon:yes gene_type:complete